MTKPYDVVVIGTGTAAATIAHACRAEGWRVAVVDHRPFGGTCALRGCDPKKVLVAAAEVVDAYERLHAAKVVTGKPAIDWQALQAFKRTFTDPVPPRSERAFREKNIDVYHGRARFLGPDRVQIGEDRVPARRIVIASGAEPVKLSVPGAEHLIDSTRFLELERLPRRIVFIGGGFIGFEFAHVAVRAGASVTILNRGSRPLNGFDPDLVDLLVGRSRALGIDIRMRHELAAVDQTAAGYGVRVKTPDGEREFGADLVVNSAGRTPAIDDLNLEAAEIRYQGSKLELNEYLQSTSNPAVYAAGDAAKTGMALTPVAALEGRAVAANLLHGNHVQPDYTGIAAAVFTLPPLARVGLLESEARERGLKYRVRHASVPEWFTARRIHEPCYAHKVLVENDTDRILGAHLLGPEAAEIINLFALAIRAGLRAQDLRDSVFAYPTAASDVRYLLP